MQSSRVVTPDDLDRPIRTALPWLARGAAGLARLGITTPREALWYLPFRYDDFSELRSCASSCRTRSSRPACRSTPCGSSRASDGVRSG